MSFSENFVVAETSYPKKNKNVSFIILRPEEGLISFNISNSTNLLF